jgi:hypothetical protein
MRGAARAVPSRTRYFSHRTAARQGRSASRGAAIVPEHTDRSRSVSAEHTLRTPSIRDLDGPKAAHRSIDHREALAAQLFMALPEARRALLLHVSGLLDEIAYGNVVIVMQDGNVIQIETFEKIRLT